MTSEPSGSPADPSPGGLPHLQVYYVTVEWLDDAHQPESPERLAQMLRHAIQQAHDHGPEMAPSRFTVRVKAGDIAAEASGLAAHHHHHPPPAPPTGAS